MADNYQVKDASAATITKASSDIGAGVQADKVVVLTVPEISGSVNVVNLPANQTISGSVNVVNLTANQTISGSVNVVNLPANQTISGSVNVVNFPATQAVSGSVALVAGTANVGKVLPTLPTLDTNFNGQVWISSSAVNPTGQAVSNAGGFLIKGHPSNSVAVYVYATGTTSGCGFPISAGELFVYSGSALIDLSFAVLSSSGCACWIKL